MKLELEGMKLVSICNARMSRWKLANLARTQRQRALLLLANKMQREGKPPGPPYKITITRRGKRKLDSDNLAASAKFVRDGIADALGIDDGDEDIALWYYRQERGEYMVEIEIEVGG